MTVGQMQMLATAHNRNKYNEWVNTVRAVSIGLRVDPQEVDALTKESV